MKPIDFLGLDYDDLSVAAAVALIGQQPAGAAFRYVVTPNADHLVRLARQPNLQPLYARAWLRLLDSRVVAAAAGLLGLAAPRVCPGSDLSAALVASLRPHDRVTVIGGSREAVLRLGVRQAAQHIPPIGFEHDQAAFAAAVNFVVAHPARYVFFAVGSPRQEMLAWAVAQTGQATGTGLCIGNSLAFLTGEARRAPPWMQRASLEWAYRLMREPRRLGRRYLLDNPPIFSILLRARLERAAQERAALAAAPLGLAALGLAPLRRAALQQAPLARVRLERAPQERAALARSTLEFAPPQRVTRRHQAPAGRGGQPPIGRSVAAGPAGGAPLRIA